MKVYSNQKLQFDNQEDFRRLNRETEIKCIDFRDCQAAERLTKIIEKAKTQGTLDVAFVCTGTHLRLHFYHWGITNTNSICPNPEYINLDKEPGRLRFKSPAIYNGVCVVCSGFINLNKFDGMAKLDFDPEFAQFETERAGGAVVQEEMGKNEVSMNQRGISCSAEPKVKFEQKVKFEPSAPSPSSSQ